MKIGYARVSTDRQDLTAQITELQALGVEEKNIYTDPGFTGTNRQRPGLAQALAAASHPGAEFVVTKLDRLARSIRDAKDIADQLVASGAVLQIGRSAYDPNDAMGKMMFNIMATFAEFEADLIRQRTREGMAVAKARGRLQGKKPKLPPNQEKRLVELFKAGGHSVGELAGDFGVSRATVYRAVQRAGVR
ncbi:recombinase family protein [Gordonia neofelifaecis]|uniref:Site-specific recombinase n=1 Tax=Gordonia neofelifaecis NRRL B-59395 TaxID=644548 RepID=F1YE56_9ACTN|nr:recombinase family protein [Gordonia neofelifaecis]EGD57146.1 site-specific recombinase [Gordonia neofelifaecis NRRL B-59395]